MKKFVLFLSAVLLVLAAATAGIVINGHYFKSDKDIKSDMSAAWMGYIRDDALLSDIIIPGSHDAGSCNMSYLGRTQGYSVKEQLGMGARYFDLRVNKTDDGYYMYHEIFNGERFEDVLSAIVGFLEENPTEALILDFQHFKGESKDDVLSFVMSTFVDAGLVVENNTEKSDLAFVSELKLCDARGKCVILFGGGDELAAEHSFIFSRNNDSCSKSAQALNSCYISEYNKMSSSGFIDTALPYYYQNIRDKIENEGYKGLFVLQGQLTDGYLIFGPYSREKTHDNNMTAYIAELSSDPYRLALTNIIMRDFLTTDKCRQIIALNEAKGLVDEDHRIEFADIYS